MSCCVHSGLDDKYSSQLPGMSEVYVGILWLIWMLNGGFSFSRFYWEIIEGYGGIVVKRVGDNVYSSSRYIRCEPLFVVRCLSGIYFF